MKVPTSKGESFLGSSIRSHFDSYTLERPSKTTGPMGGTESTTDVTVDMWVFDPMEIRDDTEYGDRIGGALGGLTDPSADVQQNDRVTYHGDTYEIAETMQFDGTHGDVYTLIDLVRMENV